MNEPIRNLLVHELIARQADETPQKAAIRCGSDLLTYAELISHSNQLARYMRNNGVSAGSLVIICLNRSIDAVVAILASLIAGGAYVPVDPAYPLDRIRAIISDSDARIVVTQSGLLDMFSEQGLCAICMDNELPEISRLSGEPLENTSVPEGLAYVIYTSGSTGKPKGVMVPHESLRKFLHISKSVLDVTAQDVYLQSASIAYAVAVRQIMVALSTGAELVIADEAQMRDPLQLFEEIRRSGVTLMDVVPSFWRSIIKRLQDLPPMARLDLLDNSLRRIVSVGEGLPYDIPHDWMRLTGHPARLVNIFGQSETTGIIAAYPIPANMESNPAAMVPIGRELVDTQLYILDGDLHPVPPGETGELCVSNPCLARGYLNHPELTEEKFIPNPFDDGYSKRLYRTGDLACQLADGNIEFLGRSDTQVKIRGQRLELGEIETALREHPGVRECVIVARGDQPDNKRLEAYIVLTNGQNVNAGDLRDFLRQRVPDYMVPPAYTFLNALPLTPNGKVDRLALPESEISGLSKDASAHPRNELERKIANIWQGLLKTDQLGINDNFFDLGGHSLLAVEMFSKIERALGVRLPITTLLRAPTISSLAEEFLSGEADSVDSKVLIPIQQGERQVPPFFCVHGLGGGVLGYSDLVRALGPDIPFYALAPIELENSEIHDVTIETMASRYVNVIRNFQPHGPYYVGGYCFGGVVAYEIACQMEKLGEKLELVAIFEGSAPNHLRNHSLFFFHPRRLFAIIKSVPAWLQDYSSIGFRHLMWRIRSTFSQLFLGWQRKTDQQQRIRVQDLLDTELEKIPNRYMELTLAHISALRRYIPGSYSGQVSVFRARNQSINEVLFGSLDPEMGWGKVARGGVDVRVVSGFHRNIHLRPYVKSLSAELRTSLNRSSHS